MNRGTGFVSYIGVHSHIQRSPVHTYDKSDATVIVIVIVIATIIVREDTTKCESKRD